MSIIIELQQLAIDSNSDILSLLRKSLVVARKLGLKEFEEWINCELNGYKCKNKIPNYRQARGDLKGYNPHYGWIPVVIRGDVGEDFLHRNIVNSIPGVLELLNSNNEILYPLSSEQNAYVIGYTKINTNYGIFVSRVYIKYIIEQVKNEILNWALVLEENGILGEGLSFSQEEKDKAKSTPQIINCINNFYGDVNDMQVQQCANESSQNKD